MFKTSERNNKLVFSKKDNLILKIKQSLRDCADFVCQEIKLKGNLKIYKMYFNALVDITTMDANVLKPLAKKIDTITSTEDLEKEINSGKFYHVDIIIEQDAKKIVDKLLNSSFVLVCENKGYIFDAKGYEKRSLDEPKSESVVKGARDCFIEAANTNISLLRRRVVTDKLKVINRKVGSETKTQISVLYVDKIADSELVKDILNRIGNMDIPTLVCAADFEEQIVDKKMSLFPQIIATERPDKAAANLVEGKIIVIIDGFPSVYILPAVFAMFMQSTEEYSSNYFTGSFIRILRYISMTLSMLLPALYISVTTFHQEMLPTVLAKSIIKSKQDVPLPAFLEIIIILLAFEVLLEAGARMPKNTGQTISIVGALIVGEAAVNAKLVSPAVIVVVAVSAICGFLVPNQDLANTLRLDRLGLVVVASISGLYGVSLATIIIIYYLCTLESFGVPYLKPFVANEEKNLLTDTIIRGIIKRKKGKIARW